VEDEGRRNSQLAGGSDKEGQLGTLKRYEDINIRVRES